MALIGGTGWDCAEISRSLGTTGSSLPDRHRSVPFIGREREMQILRAATASAVAGRGRAVLLLGESGSGKSRVLHELRNYAEQCGARVLGLGAEATASQEASWSCGRELESVIARLSRERCGLHADGPAPSWSVKSSASREAAASRFHTFTEISRLLQQLAQSVPLVIMLDDVDRADHDSLELLQFVGREVCRMRVLLVATACTRASEQQVKWTDTLVELLRDPSTERLELGPFDEAAVQQLLQRAAGFSGSSQVVASLRARSDGSPLFLTSLVLGLTEEGRLDSNSRIAAVAGTVPPRVRVLVRQRLSTLSVPCRSILQVASVLDPEIDAATLRDVSRNAIGSAFIGAFDSALAEAVAGSVFTDRDDERRRVRFTNPLIRDTVYEDLGASTRARFHACAGDVLAHATEVSLPDVVHHFMLGLTVGTGEKAVTYAMQAAADATARHAYDEASRWHRNAITALDHVTGADDRQRAALWLALGETVDRAGDHAAARPAFLQASTLARKSGSSVLLAQAAVGYAGRYMEIGRCDDQVRSLLEEALRSLGAAESGLRACVLARLAVELAYSNVPECGAALGATALATARRARDTTALAYAFGASHLTTMALSDPQERLAVSEDIIRLAEAANDDRSAAEVSGWRVDCCLDLGDITAVDFEIKRHRQIAQQLRDPVHLWLDAVFVAMRALHDGLAIGETLVAEAMVLGQQAQDPHVGQAYAAQLFFLRTEQARLHELRPILVDLVAQYPSLPAWRAALAVAYVETGGDDQAREIIAELARDGFAAPRDRAWLTAMALAAEACGATGYASGAQSLYNLLLPYRDRNVSVAGGAVSYGSMERYLGLLSMTLGRYAQAEQHCTAALEMNRRMRALPLFLHTQCDYAEILLASGQVDKEPHAADLLREVLATAGPAGMTRVAKRAEALQAILRSVPPSRTACGESHTAPSKDDPRDATMPQPAALFRREGDYWSISFADVMFRLRHTKGLQYLAWLLVHPDQEVLALDLGTSGYEVNGLTRALRAERSDASRRADDKAMAAYKQRLDALRAQLDEAEQMNDLGRAERARSEMDYLLAQLRAATGFGGRHRSASPALERARSAVSKRVAAEVKRITTHHPALGRHLAATITTGYFCCYRPHPSGMTWLQ